MLEEQMQYIMTKNKQYLIVDVFNLDKKIRNFLFSNSISEREKDTRLLMRQYKADMNN